MNPEQHPIQTSAPLIDTLPMADFGEGPILIMFLVLTDASPKQRNDFGDFVDSDQNVGYQTIRDLINTIPGVCALVRHSPIYRQLATNWSIYQNKQLSIDLAGQWQEDQFHRRQSQSEEYWKQWNFQKQVRNSVFTDFKVCCVCYDSGICNTDPRTAELYEPAPVWFDTTAEPQTICDGCHRRGNKFVTTFKNKDQYNKYFSEMTHEEAREYNFYTLHSAWQSKMTSRDLHECLSVQYSMLSRETCADLKQTSRENVIRKDKAGPTFSPDKFILETPADRAFASALNKAVFDHHRYEQDWQTNEYEEYAERKFDCMMESQIEEEIDERKSGAKRRKLDDSIQCKLKCDPDDPFFLKDELFANLVERSIADTDMTISKYLTTDNVKDPFEKPNADEQPGNLQQHVDNAEPRYYMVDKTDGTITEVGDMYQHNQDNRVLPMMMDTSSKYIECATHRQHNKPDIRKNCIIASDADDSNWAVARDHPFY